MAILQGAHATAAFPAVVADDMDVVAVRGEYVLAAPLAIGDVIQLVKFPAGSRIVDCIIDSSAAVGTASAELSLTPAVLLIQPTPIPATPLVAAAAVNGIARMNAAAGLQAPSAGIDRIGTMTVTVGGGIAGNVVGMTLFYRNARQGE